MKTRIYNHLHQVLALSIIFMCDLNFLISGANMLQAQHEAPGFGF